MIRTVLVMSIMLAACVHRVQPPCVSRCGMLLEEGDNGSMSCKDLDTAEDTMLKNIDSQFCKIDSRMCYDVACAQIFGWQVHPDNDVIVFQEYDVPARDGGTAHVSLPAVGLSDCNSKVMWLGANKDWRHGSYPHELIHVIQDCNTKWTGSIDPEKGPGHEGWEAHGVYDFIKEFRDGYR